MFRGGEAFQGNGTDKVMCIISCISVIWCIIVTVSAALLSANGVIPLGSEFNKAGPFINLQLTLVFVLNLLFLIAGVYHWARRDNEIYVGFVVQTAAIYTTALCGDLLHRLDGLLGFLFNLCIRTCVVLAGTAIAVLLMRVLKKKQ